MPLAFVPLIVVALATVAWLVLSRRSRNEPGSSVSHFSRALTAIAPSEKTPEQQDPDED